MYAQMTQQGVRPDRITFGAVLQSCGHGARWDKVGWCNSKPVLRAFLVFPLTFIEPQSAR